MTVDEFGLGGAAGSWWDGHLALLPAREKARNAQIGNWVGRGLARAERVVYCEERTAGDSGSVEQVLGSRGVDADALRASGQLEILPVWEFAAVIRDSKALERARDDGYRGIRTAAPSSTGLSLLGEAECARIETKLDEFCTRLPWSALCQYDWRSNTAAGLAMAATHHTSGIRAPLLATAPYAGGLALLGELDASNEELLAWSVHAATRTFSEATFLLDVRQVGFVGVAGWRGILRGSATFRHRGGELLLTGVPSAIQGGIQLLSELHPGPGIRVTSAAAG
jgi:anti-anti-sigma regulatory factor